MYAYFRPALCMSSLLSTQRVDIMSLATLKVYKQTTRRLLPAFANKWQSWWNTRFFLSRLPRRWWRGENTYLREWLIASIKCDRSNRRLVGNSPYAHYDGESEFRSTGRDDARRSTDRICLNSCDKKHASLVKRRHFPTAHRTTFSGGGRPTKKRKRFCLPYPGGSSCFSDTFVLPNSRLRRRRWWIRFSVLGIAYFVAWCGFAPRSMGCFVPFQGIDLGRPWEWDTLEKIIGEISKRIGGFSNRTWNFPFTPPRRMISLSAGLKLLKSRLLAPRTYRSAPIMLLITDFKSSINALCR